MFFCILGSSDPHCKRSSPHFAAQVADLPVEGLAHSSRLQGFGHIRHYETLVDVI